MTRQTIEVWRQLTDGSRVRLGTLGENHHSLLFQYHEDCLNSPLNPSPFILPFDDRIHRFSKQDPDAMPGLFTDSLSQHWGLRPLMDFFRGGQQSTVSPTGCHDLLQTTEADLIGMLIYQSDNGEIHAEHSLNGLLRTACCQSSVCPIRYSLSSAATTTSTVCPGRLRSTSTR